jgi:hypothetical protein
MQSSSAFKRSIRWFGGALTAALLASSSREARADDKQVCSEAYELTQSLRHQGKLSAAREQAITCARDVCAEFIRNDCARWQKEIESSAPTPAAPAPAADATTGGLEIISTGRKGKVFVDSEPKGEVPITLTGLSPGVHKVKIQYTDGSEDEKIVYITEGFTARARFEASRAAEVGGLRRGLHFGFWAGPALTGLESPGAYSSHNFYFYGGLDVGGLVNVGIVPAVDFRTGLGVTLSHGGDNLTLLEARIPAMFRFNLGSVYTVSAGLTVGGVSDFRTNTLIAGPEWSVLSFRFGDHRQLELEFGQGIGLTFGTKNIQPSYHQQLTLSYLLL